MSGRRRERGSERIVHAPRGLVAAGDTGIGTHRVEQDAERDRRNRRHRMGSMKSPRAHPRRCTVRNAEPVTGADRHPRRGVHPARRTRTESPTSGVAIDPVTAVTAPPRAAAVGHPESAVSPAPFAWTIPAGGMPARRLASALPDGGRRRPCESKHRASGSGTAQPSRRMLRSIGAWPGTRPMKAECGRGTAAPLVTVTRVTSSSVSHEAKHDSGCLQERFLDRFQDTFTSNLGQTSPAPRQTLPVPPSHGAAAGGRRHPAATLSRLHWPIRFRTRLLVPGHLQVPVDGAGRAAGVPEGVDR